MLERPLQGATSGWVDGGGFITLKCQRVCRFLVCEREWVYPIVDCDTEIRVKKLFLFSPKLVGPFLGG